MFDTKENRNVYLILLFLWLPGLIVGIWRCSLRIWIERQDSFVETVVDYDELRQLSRDEGWPLKKALKAFFDKGASSVGITEDTLNSLEAEGRISIYSIPEIQKLSQSNFIASIGEHIHGLTNGLLVFSNEPSLLDRIQQHLSWKLASDKTERASRQVLIIRKSGIDFRERFGLGFSSEHLELIKTIGMGVVLRVFNFPQLTPKAAKSILADLPDPEQVSAILFAEEEVLGNRGAINTVIDELKKRPYRIGLVEFNDQAGMDDIVETSKNLIPFVRVHSIGRKEIDENYNVSRAVARWIRSVRDRRLKMFYIRTFFQDKKKYIGDLLLFNLDYLDRICKKLEADGFQIPRNSVDRQYEPRCLAGKLTSAERFTIGFSLLLGIPFLIGISRRSGINVKHFFITFALAALFGLFLSRDHFTILAGLIGAVSYPTIGCILAIKAVEERVKNTPDCRFWRSLWVMIFLVSVPSFLGGILIAGLHSEKEFLLKFLQFKGIKIAFVFPLVWIFLWSLRKYGTSFFSVFIKPLTLKDLVLGIAVFAGLLLYIMRSGNITFIKPSETEDIWRTFLEDLLIARPRYKEFLIGYPACLFFLFFRLRNSFEILPVLSLFIQMGQVSLLNTFCHFHSPLAMTILRCINGLWTGIIIGFCAFTGYFIFRLVAMTGKKENKGFLVGYFGFGNLGDELLWQAFAEKAKRIRPDLEWILLTKDTKNFEPHPGIIPVSRSSYMDILEGLAVSRAIVVPGGGVLQASTSLRSLCYYVFILGLGKLGGAKLLLPAQGIGPLKAAAKDGFGNTLQDSLSVTITRFLLCLVNYLSLRDRPSLVELETLKTSIPSTAITSDFAFLTDYEPIKAPKPLKLRLGVILRGSVTHSRQIARFIVELTRTRNDLEYVPIAFQPEEDEIPWRFPEQTSPIIIIDKTSQAFSELENLTVLYSMRLHGCILATVLGVPWLGLSYDPKVKGFAQECDWNYVIEPEKATFETLAKSLEELAKNPIDLRNRLKEIRKSKSAIASEDLLACLSAIPVK